MARRLALLGARSTNEQQRTAIGSAPKGAIYLIFLSSVGVERALFGPSEGIGSIGRRTAQGPANTPMAAVLALRAPRKGVES